MQNTKLEDQHQTNADLPIDVLKRILTFVNGIQQLDTRARVSLVSRAFAVAVRQMPTITMSTQYFTGTELVFSIAAKQSLSAMLAHLTQLELHNVQSSNYSRVFTVISAAQRSESYRCICNQSMSSPRERSHCSSIFGSCSTVTLLS